MNSTTATTTRTETIYCQRYNFINNQVSNTIFEWMAYKLFENFETEYPHINSTSFFALHEERIHACVMNVYNAYNGLLCNMRDDDIKPFLREILELIMNPRMYSRMDFCVEVKLKSHGLTVEDTRKFIILRMEERCACEGIVSCNINYVNNDIYHVWLHFDNTIDVADKAILIMQHLLHKYTEIEHCNSTATIQAVNSYSFEKL